MSNGLLRWILLAASMALGGCVDADARALITTATWPGKFSLAMTDPQNGPGASKIDQAVQFVADDGEAISAWVVQHHGTGKYSGCEARGTVVVMHGIFCSKTWFLSLSKVLADRGWDVVLVDMRGHGESGGEFITWGALEKRDVKKVVDVLLARRAVSPTIYAFGYSMGACVAVQYAAFDERCQGVVAIAPPTGIDGVARMLMPLASDEYIQQVVHRAGEIGHFDPAESSALDAARKLECPLVLVHGTLDTVVPYQHGLAVYTAASGRKKMYTEPFADHITVQAMRDDWLADRVDEVEAMRSPATQPAKK